MPVYFNGLLCLISNVGPVVNTNELTLTVRKQQLVYVYIVSTRFTSKGHIWLQHILCSSLTGLHLHIFSVKTGDLVKAFCPPISLLRIFPTQHAAPQCAQVKLRTNENTFLSDLNEMDARQRNRWLLINAACVNFRHRTAHLLPAALSSSMINPWQLPGTCHCSSNPSGDQHCDNADGTDMPKKVLCSVNSSQ